MRKNFLERKSFGGRVKTKFGLSNYLLKADLKNATVADTSDVAKKTNLASLKSLM